MHYEHSPEYPLTTARSYFPPEEQAWLQRELGDILDSQLSMGPRVAQFERDFAACCGAEYGVAFPSCTAALEATLQAFGIGPDDEVLVPAETFIASGMAVFLAGARPVFTEIAADTFGMDFTDALSRITPRTRGAIVVHFGGMISPAFPAFVAELHRRGCFVIEDAAHAHGAELNGNRAGSLADAACFSFYPTKIMTTGEGGMLVTARDEIARFARSFQQRGLDLACEDEQYSLPGRNNRFTEIAAALGLSQLRCLDGFLACRRQIARIYDEKLCRSGCCRPLLSAAGSTPSYWRYVVLPEVCVDRQALKAAMAADRIAIDWPYDPPLHLQPVFRRRLATLPGMLPRTEDLLSRHFCLPVHARLRDVDAEYIVDRLLYHIANLAKDG